MPKTTTANNAANNMNDFEYQVIQKKKKSYQIVIKPTGAVILRCPVEATDEDVREIMEHHAESISQSLARMPKLPEREILTAEDVARLKREAKQYLPNRVKHFAEIMGVKPDIVKITSGQKCWASCIRRGIRGKTEGRHYTICFSYRVMMLPENLRDFLVLHELAHMIEIRHTPAFYALLAKYEPNHYYFADQVERYASVIPMYVKK
jgi:predicted metal-dependent hydrolase